MEPIETSKAAERHDMTARMVPVRELRMYPGNARRGDIEAIADSIKANGFYAPLVVQKSTMHILVGNHRYRAATEKLKIKELPAIVLDITDDEATRIVLADNKTSDEAKYDNSLLLALLEGLDDLEGTGFSEDELNDLDLLVNAPEDQIGDGDPLSASKVTDCPNCGHTFEPEMRDEF